MATAHIIHVFPGSHKYHAGALKCLVHGHSYEKTQMIQCRSIPGPLDYEPNTLPMSHAGPQTLLGPSFEKQQVFILHNDQFQLKSYYKFLTFKNLKQDTFSKTL